MSIQIILCTITRYGEAHVLHITFTVDTLVYYNAGKLVEYAKYLLIFITVLEIVAYLGCRAEGKSRESARFREVNQE